MMKVSNNSKLTASDKLKDILTSHGFIIFKMGIVFYIVKFLYFYFNHLDFLWTNELVLTAGYLIIFVIIYVISCMLNIKRTVSNPFTLATDLEYKINEYFNTLYILKEKNGLYSHNIKFTGENKEIITNIYSPITNPQEVINKIDAFILILNTINTSKSSRLVEKLMKYREESNFMLNNQLETIHENIN